MKLRPYQLECLSAIDRGLLDHDRTAVVMSTGCHAKGTPILMYNGEVKNVENIQVNELIMGNDSTPRTVLSLIQGNEQLYRIIPKKGESFTVNENHILSLVSTNRGSKFPSQRTNGNITNISVRDYLKQNKTFKHLNKLYRTDINFPKSKAISIHPYLLGVLLGDGNLKNSLTVSTPDNEIWDFVKNYCNSHKLVFRDATWRDKCPTFHIGNNGKHHNSLIEKLKDYQLWGKLSENKFIPKEYKIGSRHVRQLMLAGLIDTDGSYSGGTYDYISKSRTLSEDVVFIARSLGLSAKISNCVKKCQNDFSGNYYRVCISGNIITIPCKVMRKKAHIRKQKKNNLRTGFDVIPVEKGNYYGFELDDNHLYVMGDFTVMHNSGKTICFAEYCKRTNEPVLIVVNQTELIHQTIEKLSYFGLEPNVVSGTVKQSTESHITICSIQTLCRDDILLKLPPDAFKCIIIDEVHHAVADTFQKILNHFTNYKLIGFTATLERLKKHEGFAEIFDSICFEYSIDKGIAEGYLSPIRTELCTLPATDKTDIEEILEESLFQIADHLQGFSEHKALVFMPSIKLSKKFAGILQENNINAKHVDGTSKDRVEIINSFKRSEFNFLLSKNLLLEGFDVPDVDLLVLLRPTASRVVYAQSIGRGLRIAEGKKECLILDYLGLTELHELYKQPLLESPKEVQTREQKERERTVRDEYSSFLDSLVRSYNTGNKKLYDPTKLTDLFPDIETFKKPKKANQRMTPRQASAIIKFRIKPSHNISKLCAGHIISKLIERCNAKKCTIAQAFALKKLGVESPFNVPFNQVNQYFNQRRKSV